LTVSQKGQTYLRIVSWWVNNG